MRDALRYGVEYINEYGECSVVYFATYNEAKQAAEELSTYFEVYGILR